MRVFIVLKRVWSIERPYRAAVPSAPSGSDTVNPSAAGFGKPKSSMILPTSPRNGLKRINAQTTPNTLNMVCDKAARFAAGFPTEAAIFAVIVVPIFSPRTIAQAIGNGIHPILSIIRVMAIVADDDWRMRVRIVPTPRKIITDQNPWPAHCLTNSRTSGVCFRSGTDSFIKDRPRNRREKPTMSSPMFLC